MKLAAVDIGSNAIRLQVTNVIPYEGELTFKRLEYVRFPLRLGRDVFTIKKISPTNEAKFIKLMQAFKLLIDLYEVDDYMVCATSAMRESKNGSEIARYVEKNIGLKIGIISGTQEAEMLSKAIYGFMDNKSYLHIDVGGGSTELNLYVKREKIAAQSFKIGSVRGLEKSEGPRVWGKMKDWIQHNVKKEYGTITAIGTGGNINKIFDLANKKQGKKISLNKILDIQGYLKSFTLEERINKLQLNPDRADVILPASDIYVSVMRWAKANMITVPDTGLKDGIMQSLYEKHLAKLQ